MSQLGQDIWVLSKHPHLGTFLEVGGYNGVEDSNTLRLEREGWEGYVIEADADLAEQARRAGRRSITGALGDGRRHRFWHGKKYGGLEETMPVEWLKEHQRRKNECTWMPTVTLRHLLRVLSLHYVDYLSLDTEGSELMILKSAPLRRLGLITVEFRYDKVYLEKLCELLQPTHSLDQVCNYDAYFIPKTTVGGSPGLWTL